MVVPAYLDALDFLQQLVHLTLQSLVFLDYCLFCPLTSHLPLNTSAGEKIQGSENNLERGKQYKSVLMLGLNILNVKRTNQEGKDWDM